MGAVSAETSGPPAYPARVDSPVSRVSATHPNPAWRPKQSSLWPPVPPDPAPDPPAGRPTNAGPFPSVPIGAIRVSLGITLRLTGPRERDHRISVQIPTDPGGVADLWHKLQVAQRFTNCDWLVRRRSSVAISQCRPEHVGWWGDTIQRTVKRVAGTLGCRWNVAGRRSERPNAVTAQVIKRKPRAASQGCLL
jgi:hypothetical protein